MARLPGLKKVRFSLSPLQSRKLLMYYEPIDDAEYHPGSLKASIIGAVAGVAAYHALFPDPNWASSLSFWGAVSQGLITHLKMSFLFLLTNLPPIVVDKITNPYYYEEEKILKKDRGFFTVTVGGPILEEALFRGIGMGLLRLSNPLQAFVFGLAHRSPTVMGSAVAGFSTAFGGMIMGALFTSHGLGASIALHSLYNGSVIALTSILGGFFSLFSSLKKGKKDPSRHAP